jgi:predicted O-linked N-acetylglucosamine transferase (SPINDLY family)
MSVANSSDMQLLVQQYVQKGDWDSALQLYEQAIAAEPNVKSHYWQLGLLLLLQGQEEEAQIVWFDALSTTESDAEMQTCTAELVEILDTEARSRENSADYQTAWLLRQYIGENQPEDIDNLLRSLILSIQLNLFIPDEDVSLPQAISLLPHLSPTQVDDSLLLQVLQKILEFDKSSPISLQLVDACLAHYQDALTADPTIAEWHYRLGTIYAESQQTAEAIACYERALQLKPDYAEPYFSLGNIDLNQGNYEQAIANYKRAIRLNPSLAKAYVNLAFIQEQQGSFDVAIATLQAATQLQPSFATAFRNLGILLLKLEKLSEAEAICRDALKIAPDDVPARTTLADALIRQNRLEEAIDCLERAPTRHPDFAHHYFSIGCSLLLQKNFTLAKACYETTIEIEPNNASAYCGLGLIMLQDLRLDEAIAQYHRAVEVNPSIKAYAYGEIGQAKSLQGKADEAIHYYQIALESDPNLLTAYNVYLQLPITYDNEAQVFQYRQRFMLGMQDFLREISLNLERSPQACLDVIDRRTNFHLAFQGQNNVFLQSQYGELVHKIMSVNYPQWTEPLTMPSLGQNQKIRVGYVSTYLRNHSVGNMVIGWLRYRDRQRFEVYTYYTDVYEDLVMQEFKKESDFFYHLPNGLEAVCDRIRKDNLHILVFPDIGMHPQTTQIAGLRLSPVQCVWAGHPDTTGLPTMDYFLSSDLMEPEEAQDHYSEQLVRLPKLSFVYSKVTMPSILKSRTDLQLPEGSIIYLSCQGFFKYLPQYDYLFAQIASRVPNSKFIFFSNPKYPYVTEQLRQRLHGAFSKVGLKMEQYCMILSRLDREDYINLLLVSDVSLDSIGFTGSNTTLQAVACGLPVVTLPTELMRGRQSYGILKAVGVLDTVARSESEYIEIAVRLGRDRDWRESIIRAMKANHHLLYDDTECVRGLEQFFVEAVTEH